MNVSVRGREGRKTQEGSTFRMVAGNFFRILRSRHLRVIIFLSEHFPEIPLLENVKFSLFSVLITSKPLGSAKPWRPGVSMYLHSLCLPSDNPFKPTRSVSFEKYSRRADDYLRI
jgi:hypothetical protein